MKIKVARKDCTEVFRASVQVFRRVQIRSLALLLLLLLLLPLLRNSIGLKTGVCSLLSLLFKLLLLLLLLMWCTALS